MAIAIDAAQPSTVTPAVGGAAATVEPESQSQGVEPVGRVEENAFSRMEKPQEGGATRVLGDKREAAAEFNAKLQDLGDALANVARSGVLPSDQPTDALRAAMEEFAAAYNDVQGAYEAKARADGPDEDETAAGIMAKLEAAVTKTFPQTEGSLQSLSEVGIQPGAEGRVQVHAQRMEAAIEASPEDAVSLFTSEGGPGGAIRAAISEVYVDPLRGSLASGGLEPSIRESEQHIRSSDSGLGDLSSKLQERHTELESAVQKMSETKAYLAEQLGI